MSTSLWYFVKYKTISQNNWGTVSSSNTWRQLYGLAPEVEYEGTILIEWENCNRWIIGVDDNNPDTIGEIFQKNGILNPIDYYDPSPEIPYVGVVTSNGEVRVKIQDRDKPDPPTQGLILYVPAVHFYDYNCGTFRAQTGFTGEIRSR